MSIYGIKYTTAYYRKSEGITTIDILQRGYGGTSISLKAFGDPWNVDDAGELNNIYKPTLGSGGSLQVTALPLTLHELFTTDPQEFMVKVYDGGSEDSSGATNIKWQGFINAEIYSESYSTPASLPSVHSFQCNNGMVLFEDISYTVDGLEQGTQYTGFVSLAEVMGNIFSKLEIAFDSIRTCHTLKYGEGIYADTTNLFEIIKVNNENYYDEIGIPMSCREVLDSIFGGLGLVMKLKGTTIYIYDPIDLHSVYTGFVYDTTPTYGANESSRGLSEILDITNGDITFAKTGAGLDIVRLFNLAEIKYDPYNFSEANYSFIDEDNVTDPETYGEYTNNGITYRIYIDVLMKGWTISGIYKFEGIKEITPDETEKDYWIRQITGSPVGYFEYTFPYSNIQQGEDLLLEVSMDVFTNTRHVSNIIDPVEPSTEISSLYLKNIEIKIGDKWYYQSSGASYGVWSASQQACQPYVRELDAEIFAAYSIHGTWFRKRRNYAAEDTSLINDKWVTSILYIPLAEVYASGVSLVNGSISIKIPKALNASVTTGILNILIKNISVAVVNTTKKPIINDGILFKAIDDDAVVVKKSKLDIRLKNGIGPYGVSKGAFSSDLQTNVGLNIVGLQRTGSATYYKTTELLLQSLMGQYTSPRFVLKGILDIKDYLDIYPFVLIKDSDHLGATRFYIVGGTYNDREETYEATMIELTTTRKTIS